MQPKINSSEIYFDLSIDFVNQNDSIIKPKSDGFVFHHSVSKMESQDSVQQLTTEQFIKLFKEKPEECRDLLLTYNSILADSLAQKALLLSCSEEEKTQILNQAIINGHLHIVKTLMKFPVDLNVRKFNGYTPLMLAILSKQEKLAEFFIDQGADFELVSENPDYKGATALMFACLKDSFTLYKKLIAKGANLQAVDCGEKTALHYALFETHCVENKSDLLDALLKVIESSRKDENKNTLLMHACYRGQLPVVKLLFEKVENLKLNAINGAGYNALMHCCIHDRCHLDIVRFLLEKVPNLDLTAPDSKGKTVLFHALQQPELLQLLLEKGKDFDLNKVDKDGNTLLIEACRGKKIDAVKLLLKHGINHHLRNKFGFTALNYAHVFNYQEIISEFSKVDSYTDLSSFFLLQKMLCHRFGVAHEIRSNGRSVKMEGFFREPAQRHLVSSIRKYIENLDGIQKEKWLKFLALIESNIMSEIDLKSTSQNIFTASTGWHEHSTSLLISKNNQLLMKGNRGNGRSRPGLTVYKIKETEKSLESVLRTALENVNSDKGKEWFNGEIDRELGLEELPDCYMAHKDQTVGNCAWASAKLKLKGISYFSLLEEGVSHEEAVSKSHAHYKQWTSADRKEALKEFIQLKKEIDKLKIPHEILRLACYDPDAILTKIFFKCLQDHHHQYLSVFIDNLSVAEIIKKANADVIFKAKKELSQALKDHYPQISKLIENRSEQLINRYCMVLSIILLIIGFNFSSEILIQLSEIQNLVKNSP